MHPTLATGQHAFEHDRTIIAYYIRGRGPPCFVAPYPWGMNSEPIRSFFQPLEKKLTLIYHDPPGTGRSGQPMSERDLGMDRVVSDLFALQTRLGMPEAMFMGHSGGSACALTYAIRYPERVQRLVLIGCGARFPDILKSKEVSEAAYAALKERNEKNFRTLQAKVLGPEIRTRRGKLLMGQAMKSSFNFSIDRAAYNFEELRDWDARSQLSDVAARTLIVAGKMDKLTPVRLAKELHKGIKASKLVIFNKSGHFPFLDERERFNECISSFLV